MRLDYSKIQETGVKQHSLGYVFTQSPETRELYFYMTQCGHYYCEKGYEIRRQDFEPLLVLCVLKGTMEVDYRGEHYELGKNKVMLIDCREFHHYRAKADGLEFLYLHFDGSNAHALCSSILNDGGPLVDGPSAAVIRHMLEERVASCEKRRAETPVEESHWIYTLIKNLHRDKEYAGQSSSYVEEISRYINQHIDVKITLHELAELAALSDYHFSRKFKEDTGFSPLEYVTEKKLTYAKALLERTDESVEEIADRVGYGVRGFIHLFREREGCPPGGYRKRIRSGGNTTEKK